MHKQTKIVEYLTLLLLFLYIRMFLAKFVRRMVETITMKSIQLENFDEIIALETKSGISEAMSLQLFCILYKNRSLLWSQHLWKLINFTVLFIVSHHIQGGSQKCPYFSLAITFTKIRKPSRFFVHSYWKVIELFWCKPL